MNDWPLVELGDIFSIARGGSPRPIDNFITEDSDGINWVMIGDASSSSKFITETKKKIKPSGAARSRSVKPGDFLLTNSMSFGRPYIMRTSGCIHDGWLVLSPHNDNVNHDYFYHLLGSDIVYAEFVRRASGATVKNLNIDLVKGVKVPLPPLEAQERIAAILDYADELRRLRQRVIEQLNKLGQAIFHEMFGDLVTNPKGWPSGTLGQVTSFDDKINYGVVQPGNDVDCGVPLIRVADLLSPALDVTRIKKIGPEIEAAYSRSRLKGDEVLVGCVGSIGVIALATEEMKGANIARAIGRVPVDNRKANRTFIAEQLKAPFAQNYFRTETRAVAQPTLNIKQLIETPIRMPPIEIQSRFERTANDIEKIKRKNAAHLAQLNALFSSLQQRAFRGEL